MEYLVALLYSQAINVAETFVWVGRLWKLKPPFPLTAHEVENDGYHLLLSVFYVVPYLILYPNQLLLIVELSLITWLLNDVMWHFWSVNPRYYLEWIRFYFNPRGDQVVWYARFLVTKVAVTPRRMFTVTVARICAAAAMRVLVQLVS